MEFDDDERLDNCGEVGARRLADKIRRYWVERGYVGIRTSTAKLGGIKPRRAGVKPVWIVMSNIGPTGYPPKDMQLLAA